MFWTIINLILLTFSVVLATVTFCIGNLSPNMTAKDRRFLYIGAVIVYVGAFYVIVRIAATAA